MIYFLSLRRFLALRESGEEKENIFSGDRSIHSPLLVISINFLYVIVLEAAVCRCLNKSGNFQTVWSHMSCCQFWESLFLTHGWLKMYQHNEEKCDLYHPHSQWTRAWSVTVASFQVYVTIKRAEWQLSLTISISNSFALALIINDDSRWMSCACAGVCFPIYPAHGWRRWFAFILWNKNQMTFSISKRHETHPFNFARTLKKQNSSCNAKRMQNNQFERFQNLWQRTE